MIIGSGIGGLNEYETSTRDVTKGPSRISPFTIPKLMVNAAGGKISIHWGLRGTNSAVATACAAPPTPSATPSSDPERRGRRDDHRR